MDTLIYIPIKRYYCLAYSISMGLYIMYKTNIQFYSAHRHTPSFSAASLTGILLISLFSGALWSGVVTLEGWGGGLFVMIIAMLMLFGNFYFGLISPTSFHYNDMERRCNAGRMEWRLVRDDYCHAVDFPENRFLPGELALIA